ncbi:MAG: hypothetical protein AAF585_07810 [Verrucomicrobiota bacterium]
MMSDEHMPLLVLGIGLVLGILALVLPYRFNPFRLKRRWAEMVSEKTNHMIPKIVGFVLVSISALGLLGIGLLFLAGRVMDLDSGESRNARDERKLVQSVLKRLDRAKTIDVAFKQPDGQYRTLAPQQEGELVHEFAEFLRSSIRPREHYHSAPIFFPNRILIFKQSSDVEEFVFVLDFHDRIPSYNAGAQGIDALHAHEFTEDEHKKLMELVAKFDAIPFPPKDE